MIWVKEFQKRGSWHLHGVLHVPGANVPVGLEVDFIALKAWLEVVHETDMEAAWRYGVQCSVVERIQNVKRYLGKYMRKKGRSAAKAYEKVQPLWFKDGGRWWGVVGVTLTRSYETLRVRTVAEFIAIKRVLRSYVNSITHGHYRPKSYGAMYGSMILAHG